MFMAAYNYAKSLEDGYPKGHAPNAWPDVPKPRSWAGNASAPNNPRLAVLIDSYFAAIGVLPYRPEPYFQLAQIYRTQLNDNSRCAAQMTN